MSGSRPISSVQGDSITPTQLPMLERDTRGSSSSSAASTASSRAVSVGPSPKPRSSEGGNRAVPAEVAVFAQDPFLEPLLSGPDELMRYCTSIQDERSKTQDEVASALCTVFKLNGSLRNLFDMMLERVLPSCSAPEDTLSQDSLYKKIMFMCLREMVGRNFFQEAFGSILSEIVTYDIQLDPSRVNAMQEMATVDHLFSTANNLLDALRRSRPRFPAEAVEALLHFRERVADQFSDSAIPVVERYLFGLFMAVVCFPHPLVLGRAPGGGSQRSLIALAKVVQTTYSGMSVGSLGYESDEYSRKLAAFVNLGIPLVFDFLGDPEASVIDKAPHRSTLSLAELEEAKSTLINAKENVGKPLQPPVSSASASSSQVATPETERRTGRSFTTRNRKEERADSPSMPARSRTATLFSPRKDKSNKDESGSAGAPESSSPRRGRAQTEKKSFGSALKKLVSKDKSAGSIPTIEPKAGVQVSRAWTKGAAPTPEIAAALEAAKLEQLKPIEEKPKPPTSTPAMAEFEDDDIDLGAITL